MQKNVHIRHKHRHHSGYSTKSADLERDDFEKPMTKKEKIILGFLVGGILAFLALSVVIIISRAKKSEISTVIPVNSEKKEDKVVILTPYPTLPPIEDMTVVMNERRFVPAKFTIPKGGTVSFLNISKDPVTIGAADKNSRILDIGSIEPNSIKSIVFDTPGIYTYKNKNKDEMRGMIIISPK